MYADLRCKLDEFFVLFIFLKAIMNNLRFLILVKVFYNNKKYIYCLHFFSITRCRPSNGRRCDTDVSFQRMKVQCWCQLVKT